jgi:hypothetical protein
MRRKAATVSTTIVPPIYRRLPAENCDGSSFNCPSDGFAAAGVACGSNASNACNNPDSCDGTGACLTNFVAAGAPCGNHGDTACSNPDTCNGSGTCQPNHELDGMSCPSGVCGSGVCQLPPLVDAGSDAGDSGVDDSGVRDAGTRRDAGAAPDASSHGGAATAGAPGNGEAGNAAEAGAGGAENLDAGNDGMGVGGKPDAGIVGASGTAGTLQVDGGAQTGAGDPAGCDCRIPGNNQRTPGSFGSVVALFGLLALRRRRAA